MKTFALTVATALFALTADAKTVEEKISANKLTQNADWPAIKYYRSFKMTETLYQWDNKTLTRYLDMQGTTFVDGYRSKMINFIKGRYDALTTFDVTILQDFRNSYQQTLTKVSGFSQCERKGLINNIGGNLNTYIDRVFRQDGGFTSYLGTSVAPWDIGNVYHLYRIADMYNDHIDMYVRMSDLNVVWIHNFDAGFVSHTPRGFEPSSFSDSDFVIKECSATLQSSAAETVEPSFFLTSIKNVVEKAAPVSIQ